jgi:alpha-tubulin suppressor-like RCC1 family protein
MRERRGLLPTALVLLAAIATVLPAAARGDQDGQPSAPAAGRLTTGKFHSCVVLAGKVHCWGYNNEGELGYGNRQAIGDDDTPASAGTVDLGPGANVTAISAGDVHTCALLDNGSVRCWGLGADGRLGYGNTPTGVPPTIGDDEPVASAGTVNLGFGKTATSIAAGGGHTCAVLNDGTLRCWGFALEGRLGYGNILNIGDDEPGGAGGPVPIGAGRTAIAASGGGYHTCALLDNGDVRCWGFNGSGRLGHLDVPIELTAACQMTNTCRPYDATGRVPETTPDKMTPVVLGGPAKAISAGEGHTCALMVDGNVRCWGSPACGRLGYGNGATIGDDETPASVAPVSLGAGRTAVAISSGFEHTCAILDDGSVRCWGYAQFGQLGYGNRTNIGDDESPGSVSPVDLGPGRTAKAISASFRHTCALLDNDSVRCWGSGTLGRLGYCSETAIGDTELPSTIGPVALGQSGIPGTSCPAPPGGGGAAAPSASQPSPTVSVEEDPLIAALAAQSTRQAAFRSCRRLAASKLRSDRNAARRLPASRRASALRLALRTSAQRRRACVTRYGRTPGRVGAVSARSAARGALRLDFKTVGTDGSKLPAAHTYVIKQSEQPIRSAAEFDRAPALCKGRCSFDVTRIGANITLTVTGLRSRARYYFAVEARDNVSGRTGPRSATARGRAG